MIIASRNIKDITITNLKYGDVSIKELDEIYKNMGFLFVVEKGKFIKMKKEKAN